MRKLLYSTFSNLAESKVRRLEADSHDPRAAQLRKLAQILKKNEATRFGKEHGFSHIKNWQDFVTSVRIRDYEDFRPYIDALTEGEQQVLTVEKPMMFATTSGTTNKPKFIPITPSYMKEFRNASVVSGYYLLKNFPGCANGVAFSMTSPAEEGRTPSGIPHGSISGSLYKNEPFLIRKYISPIPYEAYLIKDYETKYYTILRIALQLPVATFYTLNPSTIQLLCRRLGNHAERLIKDVHDGTTNPPTALDKKTARVVKRITPPDPARARNLQSLLENGSFFPDRIWPSLSVVSCWTKAAASFYLSEFSQFFGDVPVCDISYGASEGRGTVFLTPDKQMLSLHSHFFEFVPEEEMESTKPRVLLADQLEKDRNYFILFTTSGGLYRYNINDVVKVTGFHNRTPLLEFQYKGGNISSFTGEKLTELQVVEAMNRVLADEKLTIRFFTVSPEFKPEPHYEVWFELDENTQCDAREIVHKFEHNVRQINIEYDVKRSSGRLSPMEHRLLKPGTYESLRRKLAADGRPDTQIKVSHLNPKNEVREFLIQRLSETSSPATVPGKQV